MTVTMFLFMFTIGSAASSLLTQAIKKAVALECNIVALINAVLVGILGTIAAYILMDVPFTLKNNVCIGLMTVCIWIGSMIGYDKVTQTITQLRR
jgi:hypothetical protein